MTVSWSVPFQLALSVRFQINFFLKQCRGFFIGTLSSFKFLLLPGIRILEVAITGRTKVSSFCETPQILYSTKNKGIFIFSTATYRPLETLYGICSCTYEPWGNLPDRSCIMVTLLTKSLCTKGCKNRDTDMFCLLSDNVTNLNECCCVGLASLIYR